MLLKDKRTDRVLVAEAPSGGKDEEMVAQGREILRQIMTNSDVRTEVKRLARGLGE